MRTDQLPKLGDKIAMIGWTPRNLHRFKESAFKAFREAYRAKGPEPLSALQPGS